MADHAVSQILDIVLLKAQAVEVLVLAPLLELDHEVDILAVADARYAEQGLHIDDSDAAKLDQVLRDLGSGSDQRLLTDLSDLHDVVRDQTVAALDQLQRHLRFADAALARDQDANAVDVDQDAVDRDAGRKAHIQPADELRHEVTGRALGHQKGHPVLHRVPAESLIRLQLAAKDHAGDVQREEPSVDVLLLLVLHLLHVGVLDQADDLNPPRRKVLKIPGHLHGRPVDIRLPDLDLRYVDLRCQVLEVHLRDHLI